jgi:hypothetical protein
MVQVDLDGTFPKNSWFLCTWDNNFISFFTVLILGVFGSFVEWISGEWGVIYANFFVFCFWEDVLSSNDALQFSSLPQLSPFKIKKNSAKKICYCVFAL